MCGVFQPSTNTTTCAWRYIECKNGRVSKLLLGEHCCGTRTLTKVTVTGEHHMWVVMAFERHSLAVVH
jgi:hypothetical protein